MNLLGAIGVEKLHRLPELGSPHDAVIHKEQLFPLNEIVHRKLLQVRHPVPFLLVGGHKAPGPGVHEIPAGAFNIRSNGKSVERRTTEHIDIISKEDGSGIDIIVKPEVRGESVHIPVIISQSGLSEAVYNDFHIGENADVTIIAGCGIHNGGTKASQHDGIHRFFIAPGAKVRYIEKHYGNGDGMGERIMNPQTIVHIAENGYMEMETAQIKGVDSTERLTTAGLAAGATLVVTERLLTHGCQSAKSTFEVALNGDKADFYFPAIL